MTLSIESANFNISHSHKIPKSLRQLIYQARQNHYEELYEEETDGKIIFEDTLLELLEALEEEDKTRTHHRYLYMGLVLAVAVQPTVKIYLLGLKRKKFLLKNKLRNYFLTYHGEIKL